MDEGRIKEQDRPLYLLEVVIARAIKVLSSSGPQFCRSSITSFFSTLLAVWAIDERPPVREDVFGCPLVAEDLLGHVRTDHMQQHGSVVCGRAGSSGSKNVRVYFGPRHCSNMPTTVIRSSFRLDLSVTLPHNLEGFLHVLGNGGGLSAEPELASQR